MAKIVKHQDLKSYWGEEDHLEVAQNKSFAQMIFETLSEKTPSEDELKIFELILNLSIDHGTDTPSAKPTIEKAQAGSSLSEAVAEGLLQINDFHGAAITPCMELLYKIKHDHLDISETQELVASYLDQGKVISGFGHRIYKDEDPRTRLLFDKLQEAGLSEEFIDIAKNIEFELEQKKGKKLPINIDGAIAVVLCTFGWEAKLGNAVFICARMPGLCAHYLNHI